MREYAVPALYTVPEDMNLTDLLFEIETRDPDHVALRRLVDRTWRPVTTATFAGEVRELAAGLIASGIEPGDRVAVMARTCYEWTLLELAILSVGAVLVPIYETSSAEQVWWILSDAGVKALFVETDDHAATVDLAMARVGHPVTSWQIDKGDLARLVEAGLGADPADVEARRRQRSADDLAMIIYTSGTTGRPKGCKLLNRSFLSYVGNLMPAGMDVVFDPSHSTLLFLPLAHSFAQVIELGALARQVELGHSPNIKNLLPDLEEFKPHLVLSVPRVFEKLYNSAKHKAHSEGKGRIFDLAESVAMRYSEALERGHVGAALRAEHALFDRLVYVKIREVLGGRIAYAVSGGAPLGARLGHFFRGIGVNVLEGYGLTETTAGATVNMPGRQRVGSVGQPVPGNAIRIAEDGEILMKGDLVFAGYWNNDEATRETFTEDGWFKTGDIGELDDDGYLRITGRKKELIVTAAGKNVAPTVLEDRLRAHPLVSQCIVVGDERPYIGALVTLDADALGEWRTEYGIAASTPIGALVTDDRLREQIQAAVDYANEAVSQAEAIKRFQILETDFTEAGGELTPTLKLKRNVVMKEYASSIEALYH
jgi:long-chain acyl-CoA synthetase